MRALSPGWVRVVAMRLAPLQAVSVFLIPGVCLSQSAGKTPVFQVLRPTVVAFFEPVTEAELDKDADLNEVLSDFQWYAGKIRKPLQESGIEFHVVYARSFRIRIRNKANTFHVGNRVGYYFVTPGKKPLVQYGVDTDDDIVATA